MVLIAAVILGLTVGYWLRLPGRWLDKLGSASLAALGLLLLVLGAQIGADPATRANLGSLGWKSFLLTLFATGGSVGGVWLLERNLRGKNKSFSGLPAKTGEESPFRLAGFVALFLAAGVGGGYWLDAPEAVPVLRDLATYSLALLLFLVGFDLAQQREVWAEFKTLGIVAVLLPAGVMVGGTLGALVGGLLLGISPTVALATGAASGFYSYSGVVVAEVVGAEAGAIVFLTNFFRELLSFFIIPVLAVRLKGSLAAMAPGGASIMDTTLPVVVRSLGTEAAPIALVTGSLVSLLVPLVLPLLLRI